MTLKTKLFACTTAALLALLVAVTAIAAGGPLRGAAATATGPTLPIAAQPAQGQTCDNGFAAKLAANLGVTREQLQAAAKQAALQQIDEALAAGRLTPEQAQRARDRVNSGDGSFFCRAGGRRGGPDGAANGLAGGPVVDAVAAFFGISRDQLRQDLRERGSLQGVAAKYGKDNPTDKSRLHMAMETALRQRLTDRGASAEQIDRIVARFARHFDRLYTAPIGQRDRR